jgi:hypothetical protein
VHILYFLLGETLAYLTTRLLNHIIFTIFVSSIFYKNTTLVILFIAILSISKFRFIIASILGLFDFISNLFYSFFAREVLSYDIYLFFTHFDETIESLVEITDIAYIPLAKLIVLYTFIYYISKREFVSVRFSTVVFVVLLFIYSSISYSFSLSKEMVKFIIELPTKMYQKSIEESKKVYPIKGSSKSIVVIFGESLRYDTFIKGELHNRYKDNKEYSYAKAISLATNTDVVLPLFINSSYNLKLLSSNRNIFKLAKRAGYSTYFYSTQYDKALKYIKPYIDMSSIDSFDNGKKYEYDSFLLDKIKSVDFDKKSLVVLQMYGTHSPYKRYPQEYQKYIAKDDTLNSRVYADYHNAFLYSEYIIDSLVKYIKRVSPQDTTIIFVSDHGQLIGHNAEFGHNQFKKEIYEVPSFVIDSNISIKNRVYQLELVNIILDTMGYQKIKIPYPYRVNGTMITGEDGYIEIE